MSGGQTFIKKRSHRNSEQFFKCTNRH
ncbi:hypothetical protein AHF37_10585 [Paragonimus kellicotti]|nr:hypothetical protein AHF37_10585 [Paragonimus kellicotti]